MKDINVKYVSAAMPPMGINLDSVYTVEYIQHNYGLNEKVVKAMFKPVDCEWADLEKDTKKNKKYKRIDIAEDDRVD